MLTRAQKKKIIDDLSAKFKASKSAIFVNYKGLPVKGLNQLKKELREENAIFKVTKKTLFDIAMKEAGIVMSTKGMEGQVAVSISDNDEVAPARLIAKFAKANENLKILGGVIGTQAMTIEEVKAVAKLSSKNDVLAQVVGTLNAPISGFVNVLAGNLRGLVQVLKAVSDVKAKV